MKKFKQLQIGFFAFILLFSFGLLIQSCDSYHFAVPLPVDKKNIYEVPKDLRGKWFEEEGNKNEFYFLNKNNILIVLEDTEKILAGAWPRLDSNRVLVNLPSGFGGSLKTIQYDSLKNAVDTIDNYIVIGSTIYELDAPASLNKGYTFQIIGDTFLIVKKDSLYIDFGQNAFLRKVNNRLYVLNIRNRILSMKRESLDNWWQIRLLEKFGKDSLKIWDCSEKMTSSKCLVYPLDSPKGDYYFNCNYTAKEIEYLKNEGFFEETSNLVR